MLLELGQDDILRGKIVTPSWYKVKIEDVKEALSKDGQSTNWNVEARIICEADTGDVTFAQVPLRWNFNSKAKGFAIGYLEILNDEEVKAGVRYDLAQSKGREIEVFVETGEYEGRPQNKVNHKYRKAR